MGHDNPGADGDGHTDELAGHLASLGVDADAVETYVQLLSGEPRVRLDDARRAQALQALTALGLTVEGPGGVPTPVP
ncbi:hypothetical protein, partial [Streptomyces sparsus]